MGGNYMRENHELDRGIICEKCLKIVSKEEYIRLNFNKPIPEDTTGRTKVVSRINLCNECYEELKVLLESFTGRKFIEKVDVTSKKEELKRLRDKMLDTQNQQQSEIKANNIKR